MVQKQNLHASLQHYPVPQPAIQTMHSGSQIQPNMQLIQTNPRHVQYPSQHVIVMNNTGKYFVPQQHVMQSPIQYSQLSCHSSDISYPTTNPISKPQSAAIITAGATQKQMKFYRRFKKITNNNSQNVSVHKEPPIRNERPQLNRDYSANSQFLPGHSLFSNQVTSPISIQEHIKLPRKGVTEISKMSQSTESNGEDDTTIMAPPTHGRADSSMMIQVNQTVPDIIFPQQALPIYYYPDQVGNLTNVSAISYSPSSHPYNPQFTVQRAYNQPQQVMQVQEIVQTPTQQDRVLKVNAQVSNLSAHSGNTNKQVRFNEQKHQADSNSRRNTLSNKRKKVSPTVVHRQKNLSKDNRNRSKSNKSFASFRSSGSSYNNTHIRERSIRKEQNEEYDRLSAKKQKSGSRFQNSSKQRTLSPQKIQIQPKKKEKCKTILIETDGLSQQQIKQLQRVSKIINGEPIQKEKSRDRSLQKLPSHQQSQNKTHSYFQPAQEIEYQHNVSKGQPVAVGTGQFMTMQEFASPKYTIDYADHVYYNEQFALQQQQKKRFMSRSGQINDQSHQQMMYQPNKNLAGHSISSYVQKPTVVGSLRTIQEASSNEFIPQEPQHFHMMSRPFQQSDASQQYIPIRNISNYEQEIDADRMQTFQNDISDKTPIGSEIIDNLSQMRDRVQDTRNGYNQIKPKFKSYNNEDINDVVPQHSETIYDYGYGEPKQKQKKDLNCHTGEQSIVTNANTCTTYVTGKAGLLPQKGISITNEQSKKTLNTEINLYVNNKAVTNLAEFSSNMSALEHENKSENTKRVKLSSQGSNIDLKQSNAINLKASTSSMQKPATQRDEILSDEIVEPQMPEFSEDALLLEQNCTSSRNNITDGFTSLEDPRLNRNNHKFISFNDSQQITRTGQTFHHPSQIQSNDTIGQHMNQMHHQIYAQYQTQQHNYNNIQQHEKEHFLETNPMTLISGTPLQGTTHIYSPIDYPTGLQTFENTYGRNQSAQLFYQDQQEEAEAIEQQHYMEYPMNYNPHYYYTQPQFLQYAPQVEESPQGKSRPINVEFNQVRQSSRGKDTIAIKLVNQKKTSHVQNFDALSQKSRKSTKSQVVKKRTPLETQRMKSKRQLKTVKSCKSEAHSKKSKSKSQRRDKTSKQEITQSPSLQPVYHGPLNINDGQYQVVILQDLNHKQSISTRQDLNNITRVNSMMPGDQSDSRVLEAFEMNHENPSFAQTQMHQQFQQEQQATHSRNQTEISDKRNYVHAKTMDEANAAATCSIGTTGIRLIYDPDSHQLYRENSQGQIVLADLQLSSLAADTQDNYNQTIQSQSITAAGANQFQFQYLETPGFLQATNPFKQHIMVSKSTNQSGKAHDRKKKQKGDVSSPILASNHMEYMVKTQRDENKISKPKIHKQSKSTIPTQRSQKRMLSKSNSYRYKEARNHSCGDSSHIEMTNIIVPVRGHTDYSCKSPTVTSQIRKLKKSKSKTPRPQMVDKMKGLNRQNSSIILPAKRLLTPNRSMTPPKRRARSTLGTIQRGSTIKRTNKAVRRQQKAVMRLHRGEPQIAKTPKAETIPIIPKTQSERSLNNLKHLIQMKKRSQARSTSPCPQKSCSKTLCNKTCRQKFKEYREQLKQMEKTKHEREMQKQQEQYTKQLRDLNLQTKHRVTSLKHAMELEKTKNAKFQEEIREMSVQIEAVAAKNNSLSQKLKSKDIKHRETIKKQRNALKTVQAQQSTKDRDETANFIYRPEELLQGSVDPFTEQFCESTGSQGRSIKSKKSSTKGGKRVSQRTITIADDSSIIKGSCNIPQLINQMSYSDVHEVADFQVDGHTLDLPKNTNKQNLRTTLNDIMRCGNGVVEPPTLKPAGVVQLKSTGTSVPQFTGNGVQHNESQSTLMTQTSTTSSCWPQEQLQAMTKQFRQNHQQIKRIEGILYKNDKNVPKAKHHLAEASAKLNQLKEKVQSLQSMKRSTMNSLVEKGTQYSQIGSKGVLMQLDSASIQKALRMERIEKESSKKVLDDQRAFQPLHGTQQFTRDVIY